MQIAANIDQVIPVFAAAKPTPKWNMLDHYLASAESLDLPSVICINKLDLARTKNGELNPELVVMVQEYRRIGYRELCSKPGRSCYWICDTNQCSTLSFLESHFQ